MKNDMFLTTLLCATAAWQTFAYNREDAVPIPAIYDTLIEKFRRGEKISEEEKQMSLAESREYRLAIDIANNTGEKDEWLEADRMGYYLGFVKHTILFEQKKYPMYDLMRGNTARGFIKQYLIDDDPYVAFCRVITAVEISVRDLDGAVNAYKDLLERDIFLADIAKKWIEETITVKHFTTDPEFNKKFLDTIAKLPETQKDGEGEKNAD